MGDAIAFEGLVAAGLVEGLANPSRLSSATAAASVTRATAA